MRVYYLSHMLATRPAYATSFTGTTHRRDVKLRIKKFIFLIIHPYLKAKILIKFFLCSNVCLLGRLIEKL